MNNKSIGFIGAGNMATALIKGLISSKLYKSEQINASDVDPDKLSEMSRQFGITGQSSNKELVNNSQIIILSVKPQIVKEVLEDIKDDIKDSHTIISIAAGIPLKAIEDILRKDVPLIRVMPNTPALIQKGVSVLAAGKKVSGADLLKAENIFKEVGKTIIVKEKMMDAVTAVSGSGPGFIFKIMEDYVNAAKKVGFDEQISLKLVMQTFLGATQLAEKSDQTLTKLREMVTSPGGTTEAGLRVLNEKGIGDIIEDSVKAACERSVELGKK